MHRPRGLSRKAREKREQYRCLFGGKCPRFNFDVNNNPLSGDHSPVRFAILNWAGKRLAFVFHGVDLTTNTKIRI